MPKTTYDKDLLLCVFLFLVTLGVWIWVRDEFIKNLCIGFAGALTMGLKSGMGFPDISTTSKTSNQELTLKVEEEKPKE